MAGSILFCVLSILSVCLFNWPVLRCVISVWCFIDTPHMSQGTNTFRSMCHDLYERRRSRTHVRANECVFFFLKVWMTDETLNSWRSQFGRNSGHMLAVISLSTSFDPNVRASFMEVLVSSQSYCLKAQFYLPTGGRICFESAEGIFVSWTKKKPRL